MGSPQDSQLLELQGHLQGAISACSDRGLYQSSKWAAELLNSFPKRADDLDSDPYDSSSVPRDPTTNDAQQSRLEAQELQKFLLAKSFFDCREYDRCASVFLPSTRPRIPVGTALTTPSPPASRSSHRGKEISNSSSTTYHIDDESLKTVSNKALFLAIYAKYLAGEKRKDEDSEMILGPSDGGVTLNKELPYLTRLLGDWLDQKGHGGGWLEYLYGILLAKNKNDDQAKEWFLKSVHVYPYNWGAWQELSNLLGNTDELAAIKSHLPRNIMAYIFIIYTNQELGQSSVELYQTLDQILTIFPASSFLKSQKALMLYHAKDYDESNTIFTDILKAEPYRLDSLDNFSNCMYVLDHRPRLAFLAQLAAQTDKFRPETCIIVGNYYSHNSEHEKAVMYFRRALTLDRCFQAAWTLMGHEYVEMKNTHAALESYRRAVDVNRKDYRAWHGLGLTYEMLEMHSYALFYHQRAAALRPYDAKTWQAVGSCFARVGKVHNAIRAYKRALIAGSYDHDGQNNDTFGGVLDPESLYQIALLYESLDNSEECAAYMELVLAQEEGPDSQDDNEELGGLLSSQGAGGATMRQTQSGTGVTPTTSRARMWLAKWCFINKHYERANSLANELCQDGVEVEEAKALIRDIRSRQDSDKTRR